MRRGKKHEKEVLEKQQPEEHMKQTVKMLDVDSQWSSCLARKANEKIKERELVSINIFLKM